MADNELALVGGAINASTVSECLTQRLENTLLEAADAKEAAKAVAADPKLLAEARDRLNVVSRLAGPTPKDEVYNVLQKLVVMYGAPDFGQDAEAVAMQKVWFDIYYDVLKNHPREALDLAVFEVLRTRKYSSFPQAAEISAMAQEATDEIRLIAFRLQLAVKRADEHKPAPKRTMEDTAAVRQMMAGLRGPDGRIQLGAGKSMDSVVPPSDRRATAEALRKLADL